MISNCCDAPDRSVGEDGPDFSDLGICPECKDHCTFEDYSKGTMNMEEEK